MDYITAKEASVKWGLSQRRIQSLCMSGTIAGAIKFGREWAIHRCVDRPNDKRIKTGKYKKVLL